MIASYSKCWKTEKLWLKNFFEMITLTILLNVTSSKFAKAIKLYSERLNLTFNPPVVVVRGNEKFVTNGRFTKWSI